MNDDDIIRGEIELAKEFSSNQLVDRLKILKEVIREAKIRLTIVENKIKQHRN